MNNLGRSSSCRSRRHISDTDLIYRPDFLYEPITQLIQDKKNKLSKIFDNPLFKTMLSSVRVKIFFIEYKYFGLNADIFY